MQMLEKEMMLQEQAKIERDDFQRICNEQKNQREQQLKIEKDKQVLFVIKQNRK